MPTAKFSHWMSALNSGEKRPAYLLIADLIEADIDTGRLQVRDKLPTLRVLADHLQLNYTTVARAYSEAQKRGLIDSNRRSGTFVKGKTASIPLRGGTGFEMTMNLPPEPRIQALLDKIRAGANGVFTHRDIYPMLRYQDFGGTLLEREAGVKWLERFAMQAAPEQVLVCPGIHSALVALLSQVAGPGGSVAVQGLVYPGLKAIASQLGVSLIAVDSDINGPLIRPLEDLCKQGAISAIYLNPTIQNPTALTISESRREAIADLALKFNVVIIEDDAYGMLPDSAPPSLASLAPEMTYYVSGLSKCFGAGLRIGYLRAPNKLLTQRIAGAMRALNVMASPITSALACQWILDGTVDMMLDAIREEARARQSMAAIYLRKARYQAHENGFHLWLKLPRELHANPTSLAAHLRSKGVSAVSSAAFCTDNNPPDGLRICLGGSLDRHGCEEALQLLTDMLEHPVHLQSVVL